ncbi:MAG: hypothetical protein ACE5KV_06170 [Thermoplasmata archaeon]
MLLSTARIRSVIGSAANYVRRKAWKERAEKLPLGPKAVAEKRRTQGRGKKETREKRPTKPARRKKSEDSEQPIHKKIGISERKLEKVVAEWKKFPSRGELDENGRPKIGERQNVRWIEASMKMPWGTVDFHTAHSIYHEVLTKGIPCDFEIGYNPEE